MMRIALLHGAEKNAGDFLIKHRSKELLERVLPDLDIIEINRNRPLDGMLHCMNSCDRVVFAGGPGYVKDMYPHRFPLVENIDLIKPPLFALGMGGKYSSLATARKFEFSKRGGVLISRFVEDGFGLGCRDGLTWNALERQYPGAAIMTGCPAWYDEMHMGKMQIREAIKHIDGARISVSDPASERNMHAAQLLVSELRSSYPHARIVFVFHRGWTSDEYSSESLAAAQLSLKKWLEAHDVQAVDISYGYKGFSIYNSCDIHVGFRVHAHLYNLSQRIPSFLLEEDCRGYGANETLGLSHAPLFGVTQRNSYVDRISRTMGRHYSPLAHTQAKIAIKHVVSNCETAVASGFTEHSTAFSIMNDSYRIMLSHIERLNY